jgi:SPP1 gp7 family putative phage head morphogenesis protein
VPRKDPRLETVAKTANEAIQDATIRHMLYMEGLKTRYANEILKFLDDEIIPDLKEQLAIRLERHMKGKQTTERLEAMIAQFEKITRDFKNINTRVQGELFEIALYEAEFNLNMLKQETPVNINYVLPSPEIVAAAITDKPFDGRLLGQWFESIGESTQTRLASEIRRGVTEGQTTQQIVKRVMDSGMLETTRAQTNAVVRTAVQHSASVARDEMFKANSDVIKGLKYTATLDSRTSALCRSRDNKVYDIDKAPPLPAHISCRSVYTPVLKSFRELGIDVDEVEDGARASMNGQVPADLTYSQWLKGQTVSIQNDALGVTKATLFRKGDLPLDRFINRNGHEFTLKELREKEFEAFKKAGLA